MIFDPYVVLGLSSNDGDEEIRRRYLELVKKFPPDRDPERAAAVREAYDLIKDEEQRVKYHFFYVAAAPNLYANWKAAEWKNETKRTTSQDLLGSLKPAKLKPSNQRTSK